MPKRGAPALRYLERGELFRALSRIGVLSGLSWYTAGSSRPPSSKEA
ncbi:hypothetical protein [Microbispora sp. H10670]|nr:hypothetical protein [Microbispora sp. H10670]